MIPLPLTSSLSHAAIAAISHDVVQVATFTRPPRLCLPRPPPCSFYCKYTLVPPPTLPPVPPTVRAPHDSFSLGHSFSNPSRAALLTCDRRDRPFIVSITLAIQSLSLSAFGFGGLDYFTTIPGDSHTTYRHNENPFRDQAPLSSWCSSIPNPLPAL